MWGSWQLGPTLRSARGHRAAAFLVTLQLALGLAITIVSVQVGEYMYRLGHATSGLADRELTLIEMRLPGHLAESEQGAALRRDLLERIRKTDGVAATAVVGQLPLAFFERTPDELTGGGRTRLIPALELEAGPGIVAATDLRLVGGRDFVEADLGAPVTAAIVSASLARQMFGEASALGRELKSRAHGRVVIVGVVGHMRLFPDDVDGPEVLYASLRPASARILVLARSSLARVAAVRAELAARLVTPGVVVATSPAAEYMEQGSRGLFRAVGIVVMLVTGIVVVVLIGSMALTYFLVQRRTREIGLRRAMGATRSDVVLHFMVGNVIMLVVATVIALAITVLMVPMLSSNQDGFSMNWWYVTGVVVAVWVLNLAATLVPARKAASVPPSVASAVV